MRRKFKTFLKRKIILVNKKQKKQRKFLTKKVSAKSFKDFIDFNIQKENAQVKQKCRF